MENFHIPVQTLNHVRGLPRLVSVGGETRQDPSYRFQGKERPGGLYCIFQFTLSGWGIFQDATGPHRVSSGQGFLCESTDPATSYYYAPENRAPWCFIYACFVGVAAHTMVRALVQRFGAIYSLPRQHPVIRQLFAMRVHNQLGVTLAASQDVQIVSNLLHALVQSQETLQEDRPEHRLVCSAKQLIDESVERNLKVVEIAASLQVSREHLSRIFHQHTGKTLYQYTLERKLLHACRLLQQSELTVKEVATRLGFASATHFVRIFHHCLGQTPGTFRASGIMPAVLNHGTRGAPQKES